MSSSVDAGRVLVYAAVLVGAVVAVGLVAALFGGGGGPAGPNATTTTGPGPGSPTTGTPTTDLGDLDATDYPPGVSPDAVNASAVALAHRRSLSGRAYRTRLGRVQRVRTANGTARVRLSQTVRTDGEGRVRTLAVQSGGSLNFRREAFVNDSVAVQRTVVANDTRYGRVNATALRGRASGWLTISRILALGNFTPEAVLDTGPEGATLRLRAGSAAPGAAANFSAGELRSYAGRAVVGPGGRVSQVNVTIAYVDDRGRSIRVQFRYGLLAVGGVDVPAPDWVGEAVASTAPE